MPLPGRDKGKRVRSVQVFSKGLHEKSETSHPEWCRETNQTTTCLIETLYIYIYIFFRSLHVQKNAITHQKAHSTPWMFLSLYHMCCNVLQRQSVKGQPFGSLAQVSICRHLLVVLPCHTCIFSVGIDDLRYGGRKAGMQHGLKDQRTTKPKPFKENKSAIPFSFCGHDFRDHPPKKKTQHPAPGPFNDLCQSFDLAK